MLRHVHSLTLAPRQGTPLAHNECMYDPNIPGVGWRMHYDRLERVYGRLQSPTRSSVDYGDDLQHFFQDCLHLADWIGNDQVTQIDFTDIQAEMLSHPALQDAADLGNASKHMVRGNPLRRTHATSGNVTVFLGQDKPADIRHTVTRADGTTLSAQDLVRDAFDAWQSILRARGLVT